MEIYADTKTHFTTDNNQRRALCGVKVRVVGLMGFRMALAPATKDIGLVDCPICLQRLREIYSDDSLEKIIADYNADVAKVKGLVAEYKQESDKLKKLIAEAKGEVTP